jgi:DNA-binding PadR family transcriptional regulator
MHRPLWTVKGRVNATQASLLAILDSGGGELTGGDLVRTAELRIGQFWSITRSQVYRELVALEREGLVVPGVPGARDARPVRITEVGREQYRSWLTSSLPGDSIRIPVLLAVSFGANLDPAAMRDLLAASEDEHRRRLEAYQELDAELAAVPGGEPWARATVSFGMHYERAVLDWFSTLPDDVRP